MKKVLVLGSNGMAGHVISLFLKNKGYLVFGFARTKSVVLDNYFIGDVTNFELLKSIIYNEGFDVIINAVGLLNKTAEENMDLAVLINSYLPHFLAKETNDLKTKVIHMSTDCVFSGKKGNYRINDLKDGYSFYDRSKALGEIDDGKNLTFRNSIIGPDLKTNGIGLFNWFMNQHGMIDGYKKVYWSGVTTIELARGMYYAIESNLTGLYQLTNNEKITKLELLKLINKRFEKNIKILPSDKVSLDKSLVNERKDFDFNVKNYSEMVDDLYHWICENEEIYKHYQMN